MDRDPLSALETRYPTLPARAYWVILRRFTPLECGIHGSGLMSLRRFLGVTVLLVIGVTVAVQLPTWITVLLGSMALASLYIAARLKSRFDPLDPRFGSCIPPITRPRDQG
jgi:hypothetical protein